MKAIRQKPGFVLGLVWLLLIHFDTAFYSVDSSVLVAAPPEGSSAPSNELPTLSSLDALGDPLPEGARMRFGTKRFRAPGNVHDMVLSPDEKTVITFCDNVIGWNTDTGKEIWRISSDAIGYRSRGSVYGERSLAFSHDSSFAYAVGKEDEFNRIGMKNGDVTSIPIHFGEKIPAFPLEGTRSIDVLPDGKLIACGSASGLVVCDSLGNVVYTTPNEEHGDADFNSDDRLMFGGGNVMPMFSRNGQTLAVCASDSPKKILICRSSDGKTSREIELKDKMVRMAFSPDGRRIVVTERDNAVRLYDIASGEKIWEKIIKLKNPYENYTSCVAIASDGKSVAVGATDNRIYVLDSESGSERGVLEGHSWYPWSCQFSKDSQTLYSAGWDGPIRRWNMKTFRPLPLPEGAVYGTAVVATSPDGLMIAQAQKRGRIVIASSATGTEVMSLEASKGSYSQIAFSHDCRYLAAGGAIEDDVFVEVWDLGTKDRRYQWRWPKGKDPHSGVEALAFTSNGQRLAAAVFRQSSVYMWNLDSGEAFPKMKHSSVYGLDFSPDGETLVTVGWDKMIREWNADDGRQELEFEIKDQQFDLRMYAVTYSPTKDLIATAHMDGKIRVWNADDWSIRTTIDVPGSFRFGALQFAKDGMWLAAGTSGVVILCDPWTGEVALEAGKHESSVYTVSFGNDIRTVVSGGSDGMAYQWDLRRSRDSELSIELLWELLATGNADKAIHAFWALTENPHTAVKLIETKLGSVKTLFDLQQITNGETGDAASQRRLLSEKMAAENDEVETATAARRGLSLLHQLNTEEANRLLKKLADKSENEQIRRWALSITSTFVTPVPPPAP